MLVLELGVRVVAVDGERHVEALLLERVADRVPDRGLVVGDQDAAVAHHATGVGAGLAIGSLNQKVLPSPDLRAHSDLAVHQLDHAPRDREAEPEALLLIALLPL